ncbi:MaoC family dehydratase [Natronococcus sp. A-GB7]|uniref:MaoC family dehydratase n=1 Tax=Natronococcus sp. A-GB7 TaxID=3037649 RepID=UPI0031BAA869
MRPREERDDRSHPASSSGRTTPRDPDAFLCGLVEVERMTGLYYEEFEVGETIEHERRRTISEGDNQRFCDMTMNQQPLHLDEEFAGGTQFGERLVNGLYTMSLAVGVSIPETTDGTIVANLSYDDVEHPQPVFHGDTIRVQSTVTDKRETSDGERGIVTMRVEAFNQSDELVCEFERTVLSLKREHAEAE